MKQSLLIAFTILLLQSCSSLSSSPSRDIASKKMLVKDFNINFISHLKTNRPLDYQIKILTECIRGSGNTLSYNPMSVNYGTHCDSQNKYFYESNGQMSVPINAIPFGDTSFLDWSDAKNPDLYEITISISSKSLNRVIFWKKFKALEFKKDIDLAIYEIPDINKTKKTGLRFNIDKNLKCTKPFFIQGDGCHDGRSDLIADSLENKIENFVLMTLGDHGDNHKVQIDKINYISPIEKSKVILKTVPYLELEIFIMKQWDHYKFSSNILFGLQ